MHLGFSWVGVLFLCALFVPNALWARNPPPGYAELSASENRALGVLERIGQACTCVCAVICASPAGFSWPWVLWLVGALVLMTAYERAWIRYFRKGRTLQLMEAPIGFVPVPLATLPVAAFLILAAWCQSWVFAASVVVLGVGHIGIHVQHLRELEIGRRRQNEEQPSRNSRNRCSSRNPRR